MLNSHDNDVSQLSLCHNKTINKCSTPINAGSQKFSSKRLSHTREAIHTVSSYLPTLTPVPDATMTLQQFKEQLTNLVHELVDVSGAKS